MSKSFRQGKDNIGLDERMIRDLVNSKNNLPLISNYYFSILNNLNSKGYKINYIIYMSKKWMYSFCKNRDIGMVEIKPNFRVFYTSNPEKIYKGIRKSKFVLVRGNYSEWNPSIRHIKGNWAFLPCWSRISPATTKVNLDKRCTVLIDDKEYQNDFIGAGFKSEIFKKPAMELFSEEPEETTRLYDFSIICSKTDREHKRIDLFLDSLLPLDLRLNKDIKVAIVGNSSFHDSKITNLNLNLKNVEIIQIGKLGRVGKKEVIKAIDQSNFTICTSSIDANPRVIVESLTRDRPVLCASDLKGGKFQINKNTGAFFDPNPEGLANAALSMLKKYKSFSPNKYAIKIEDSAAQFIKIMEKK